MADVGDTRGILFPTKLPVFHREPAAASLSDLIRWFWIPRWQLEPGRISRQMLLSYPASNLVVEPGGVSVAGPTTRVSHRDLEGSGWAVGALLRPAAVASLRLDPHGIQDAEIPVDASELHSRVSAGMLDADETAGRARAIQAFTEWASETIPAPDEDGLLANAMEDLIAGDRSIIRVEQVAQRLSLSTRAVQRLAKRHVGLAPLAVIRRYRLQEAAQRLREDSSTTISQVAAELGYADHAHLSTDFRNMLGFTPSCYRTDASR